MAEQPAGKAETAPRRGTAASHATEQHLSSAGGKPLPADIQMFSFLGKTPRSFKVQRQDKVTPGQRCGESLELASPAVTQQARGRQPLRPQRLRVHRNCTRGFELLELRKGPRRLLSHHAENYS